MTPFQGIVLGLLVTTLARSYATGHDVRDDWSSGERVVIVLVMLAAQSFVGAEIFLWITA